MFRKITRFFLIRLVGKHRVERLLSQLATAANINLLNVAYQSIGIIGGVAGKDSPEEFLVRIILARYLKDEQKTILFDVGANTGVYSQLLRQYYTNATVYAFEPNSNTFPKLLQNSQLLRINPVNFGLGTEEREGEIFTYERDLASEHATIHKAVFTQVYQVDTKILASPIHITTLDLFCEKQGITKIDFLKIDTEGHELAVLKGGMKLLKKGSIKIIQFEFNSANIASRVFLRDFYDLLPAYKLFRLKKDELYPIFEYDAINEIFRIHNIIAIHKDVCCE